MENIESYYKLRIGPIVLYYLIKLDEYIRYFDDGKTSFLFCSRAGNRIYSLYNEYLKLRKATLPNSCKIFWVSRLLVCKAFFNDNPHEIGKILKTEYDQCSAEELIKGLLRSETRATAQKLDLKETGGISAKDYLNQMVENQKQTSYLFKYFSHQNKLFKRYVNELSDNNRRLVLIDSGWHGTIQTLLHQHLANYEFQGVLFGRMADLATDKLCFNKMIGLIFETELEKDIKTFDRSKPQNCFAFHRHIIEDLFEPGFSSIESLKIVKGDIVPSNIDEIKKVNSKKDDDRYAGVLSYIRESTPLPQRAKVQENFFSACSDLAEAIIHPQADDLKALGEFSRTSDFGKYDSVPVLLPCVDRNIYDSAESRVKDSIWPFGQIAMEYNSDEQIKRLQKEFFINSETNKIPSGQSDIPLVAVITRTKNRPVLLDRAARSIANQSFQDYIWIVVNDGGDIDSVFNVLVNSSVDQRKIKLINNPKSLGMEAASNRGVLHSNSKYISIHDDDDTWEASFLHETVRFLESKNDLYGGVITHSTYISEEIVGDNVITHSSFPYNEWVKAVHLAEMAHGNIFAPIAFLFRRDIYEEIGGFDETLPVLGDWDFNLRFLTKVNIGVIPKRLANYHHRDVNNNPDSEYSNSVIGGIAKHQEFEPIVRNKYLREEHKDYHILAELMTIGYLGNSLRHLNNQFKRILESSQGKNLEHDKDFLGENESHFFGNQEHIIGSLLELVPYDKGQRFFDEQFYLNKNSDVKKAVQNKQFKSGYQHYLLFGKNENRQVRFKQPLEN